VTFSVTPMQKQIKAKTVLGENAGKSVSGNRVCMSNADKADAKECIGFLPLLLVGSLIFPFGIATSSSVNSRLRDRSRRRRRLKLDGW